jgi:hypothetical protein
MNVVPLLGASSIVIEWIQPSLPPVKSGEIAQLYDKWFMKPIPPANTTVNLPASDETKAAWANPTDKPAEEYARR